MFSRVGGTGSVSVPSDATGRYARLTGTARTKRRAKRQADRRADRQADRRAKRRP